MRLRFRRILVALALALAPVAVSADTPPATYTVVGVTTTTVIKAGPGIFFGVTSTVAQTTVVTCWDNTAASGNVIYQNTTTLATPLGPPPGGLATLIGITCSIATSVVAPGYTVLWK